MISSLQLTQSTQYAYESLHACEFMCTVHQGVYVYLYVCVQLQVLALFGNGQHLIISGKITLCKFGVFMCYKHRTSSDDVTYN